MIDIKEENLVNLFTKSLNLIQEKLVGKLEGIPIYGPVLYVITDSLIDSIGTVIEGSFEEVYKERISDLYVPIRAATDYRLDKFFNMYPELKEEFPAENKEARREAYPILYSIFVLEDVLVRTAYHEEIEKGNYKSIVANSKEENNKIVTLIRAINSVLTEEKYETVLVEYKDIISDFLSDMTEEYKTNEQFKNRLILIAKVLLLKVKKNVS